MVKINGEDVDAAGISVEEYLGKAGFRVGTVAVELNEVIIHKEAYSATVLKDGDVMEIVRFMGGGA